MAEDNMITVEVAYARPDVQVIIPLQVMPGTTLIEAIQQSGILEQFREINLDEHRVGIFSKIAKPDTVLQEKDRVEIYRPLIADPKESRRRRAEKKQHTADAGEEDVSP